MVSGGASASNHTRKSVGKSAKSAKSSKSTKSAKTSRPRSKKGAGAVEDTLVYHEPVLIGPPMVDEWTDKKYYLAVDYENKRYRVGDHVAVVNGEETGREWCAVIEELFAAEDGSPMFRGRWYWSVADVQADKPPSLAMRKSKGPVEREMIASDNREDNLVETISRRCHILALKNYRDMATKEKEREKSQGIYYCDRMYYHKAKRFHELCHLTFPGDPIPAYIRPIVLTDCDSNLEADGDALFLRRPLDDNLNTDHAHTNPPITKTELTPAAQARRLNGDGDNAASTNELTHPEDDSMTRVSTYFLY